MGDLPRGRFIWYELLTKDPEEGKKFYQDVIGWSLDTVDVGVGPYSMFLNGETHVAGVMELPEEAAAEGGQSHWLAYICVPDVEQTITEATGMGATKIMGPMTIPEVGVIAMLADPQGAVFAAYTPAQTMPDPGAPQPGQVSWHELITTDYEAAFDFYSRLVGWEKTSDFDMGEMGIYQMYGVAGVELGGMFNLSAEMPAPPNWLIYISVADLDAALQRVTAGGGQILNGPMEVPGGDRIAQCTDPAGAAFALHSKAAG